MCENDLLMGERRLEECGGAGRSVIECDVALVGGGFCWRYKKKKKKKKKGRMRGVVVIMCAVLCVHIYYTVLILDGATV